MSALLSSMHMACTASLLSWHSIIAVLKTCSNWHDGTTPGGGAASACPPTPLYRNDGEACMDTPAGRHSPSLTHICCQAPVQARHCCKDLHLDCLHLHASAAKHIIHMPFNSDVECCSVLNQPEWRLLHTAPARTPGLPGYFLTPAPFHTTAWIHAQPVPVGRKHTVYALT